MHQSPKCTNIRNWLPAVVIWLARLGVSRLANIYSHIPTVTSNWHQQWLLVSCDVFFFFSCVIHAYLGTYHWYFSVVFVNCRAVQCVILCMLVLCACDCLQRYSNILHECIYHVLLWSLSEAMSTCLPDLNLIWSYCYWQGLRQMLGP